MKVIKLGSKKIQLPKRWSRWGLAHTNKNWLKYPPLLQPPVCLSIFSSREYSWNPSCALCQVDHSRRTHDYDPFIRTFVTMLAEQGHVAQLVEQQTSLKRRLAQTRPPLKQLKRVYKRRKPRWILTLKWRREKRSSRWWKILCIPNGGG